METSIVYWGYIGIMENEMETTTMGYIGVIGGVYWVAVKELNLSYYIEET